MVRGFDPADGDMDFDVGGAGFVGRGDRLCGSDEAVSVVGALVSMASVVSIELGTWVLHRIKPMSGRHLRGAWVFDQGRI